MCIVPILCCIFTVIMFIIISVNFWKIPASFHALALMEAHYAFGTVEADVCRVCCLCFSHRLYVLTVPSAVYDRNTDSATAKYPIAAKSVLSTPKAVHCQCFKHLWDCEFFHIICPAPVLCECCLSCGQSANLWARLSGLVSVVWIPHYTLFARSLCLQLTYPNYLLVWKYSPLSTSWLELKGCLPFNVPLNKKTGGAIWCRFVLGVQACLILFICITK